MNRPTIAALINARLQSSRLPRKLLRPFAGRTLIDLALDKLGALDFVDRKYYAVAEEELVERLQPRHAGVELLRRDPAAVRPGFNGIEVVFGHCRLIEADYILWLNPCSPLLSADTLRRACDQVAASRFNSYTSVVPTTDWIFDDQGRPITNRDPAMISTAHSPKYYRVAHAFHVMNKAFFVQRFVPWTFSQHDPELIAIPEGESFDVNTPIEFDVAEAAFLRVAAGKRL